MKYNVGDVVKLRDDLEVGKKYNKVGFHSRMKNIQNIPIKITNIDTDGDYETDCEWYINDEMIEGLWEECNQVSKLKLIDVLNMIAKGELKEGTKVKYDEETYTFNDENELERGIGFTLLDDIYMNNLSDECELIEPPCEHEWREWSLGNRFNVTHYRKCKKCGLEEETEYNHFADVGKMAECVSDKENTLEPFEIEELDEVEFAQCDATGKCYRLFYKLNEVIRVISKE